MMKKRILWIITLTLLFAVGLGIRLVDFDNPPLDFHPSRQMHSALMARSFYLQKGGTLPGKNLDYIHGAHTRGLQEAWIEPPIFEKLVAKLYEYAGDADLRIPRACSIFFWLIGGLGLFKLTKHLFGKGGQFFALAWLLCFPYGVFASRSFQPDIIMVMLLIWSIEALCRWMEAPHSWIRAIITGLITGSCILVKQTAAFPLGLAMAFFILSKVGLKKALKNPWVWLCAVLSLAPMLAYNYWGYFVKGFLVQQYQGRFFLSELISPSFYVRWARMIDDVFTIPLFIAALVGIFLLKDWHQRALWLGYLLGYIVYGLCLPHHIGTHNYYQLAVFPLAAVGLGSLADTCRERVSLRKYAEFGLGSAALILLGWWLADSVMTLHRKDYRAWPERWIALTEELEVWDGSISTIGIMDDYGEGMAYWGLKAPMIWDTNVESMSDYDALWTLNTTFWNFRYLVITDLPKFYEQPRLQQYLNETARIYRQEPDYLIYELNQ